MDKDTGKNAWIIRFRDEKDFSTYQYACGRCGEEPLRNRYGKVIFSTYCPFCGHRLNETEEKK